MKAGILIGLIIAALVTDYAQSQTVRNTANKPIARARRFTVTTSYAILAIQSGKVQRVICQNVGSNNVRINFDSQAAGQYWMAGPNEYFPEISFYSGLNINARSMGADSELQCLVQSK
jgi:hypothetical protein